MTDEEMYEEVAARLDDLESAPIVRLSDLVTREGACMGIHVGTEEPTWMSETASDREVAATICAGCPVPDECLELELRTAGFTTLGVWGALADDDRRAVYLAWLRRRDRGSAINPEHWAPLEAEPVSVHAPTLPTRTGITASRMPPNGTQRCSSPCVGWRWVPMTCAFCTG